MRILIVDDHHSARAWLERAAASAFPEAQISTAADAAGARDALSQPVAQLPDLALIDLGLPDGDGTSLIALLKQRAPNAMAIVSTMFDDDGHLFPALRAGAQGYVLKDEPQASLIQLLQGIANGQPPLSASIARRMLLHFSAPLQTLPPQTPAAAPAAPQEHLTERENDALRLIAKGYNVPKIAELLGISKHTVAGYVRDVYRKLSVSSRAEATMAAAQRGLIGLDGR